MRKKVIFTDLGGTLLDKKYSFEGAEKQIKKVLSDLDNMQYLYDGDKTDLVSAAAFYATYQSLLAILYKLGYESRNQECTITAVEYFIKREILKINESYTEQKINHIFRMWIVTVFRSVSPNPRNHTLRNF